MANEDAELALVQKELSDLIDQTCKIRQRYDDQRDAEVAPLYKRIMVLRKRKIQLKPPACFGQRDDLDLPACDFCDVAARCYRAMKARQGGF